MDLLAVLIFVGVIIYLYLYVKKCNSYWKDLGVPYAEPTLLFGNVLMLLNTKCSSLWFRHLYSLTKHPFYGCFALNKPLLLVRDPELIKKMFVKDSDSFAHRLGGLNCKHDKIGGNAMFYMKSPTWKIVRKALVPFFSPYKLAKISTIAFKIGDNLVDYIKSEIATKSSIDVPMMVNMYTTDIIGTSFFGFSAESLTRKNSNYYIVSEMLGKASFKTLFHRFCFAIFPRVSQLFKMRYFDETSSQILKRLFENSMEERKDAAFARGDLIDLLNTVEKTKEEILDHDEIVAQAFQLQLGGLDTSPNATILALHEISLQPQVQARLRQEITEVLSKHEALSLAVVAEMVYLDMVVSETLRKHPIVPVLERSCNKSYKIPDTNVVIEKGVPCYVPVYGLHYDSEFFPNPEKFDPERFSSENKPNIVSGTYLPFGVGPRNCIAARLGLLVVKVALIKIIHNFEIEPDVSEKREIGYDSRSFFIRPNKNSTIMNFKPVRKNPETI